MQSKTAQKHPSKRPALTGMLLALLNLVGPLAMGGSATAGSSPASPPFLREGKYEEKISSPGESLGFELGERPVRHHEVVDYFKRIEAESDRAQLFSYGSTHEGRDLLLLAVSSESNIRRLEELRGRNSELSDPRTTESDRLASLIETNPLFAWMGYTIHGDEISGTDAAVQLAYQLVAGEDETSILIRNRVVVLIDPLQNPDGRERYLAQIQQSTGARANPDNQSLQHQGFWPWGRGNHYLFDLNRDYLPATQPESRGRVEVFARWNPQLVVDAHEMGGFDTYLFSPPREPFNRHFSEVMFGWTEKLAADQARAFDQYGWPYYTREWADNWYPGYTDAFASLCGAVGMLYEQAGVDGSLLRKPDGTIATYRESVHHQFISSFANLETVSRNRKPILSDYVDLRQANVQGQLWPAIGKPHPSPEDDAQAYLIVPDGSGRAEELVSILESQGIEVQQTKSPARVKTLHDSLGGTSEEADLPGGTFVILLDQPRSSLVRAILGFDPRMTDAYVTEERRSLERGTGSRLYDITAWSLPLAFHVRAYWTAEDIGAELEPRKSVPSPAKADASEPSFGYLLSWRHEAAPRALVRLFERKLLVRASTRPFQISGATFDRGTLLVPKKGNPEDLAAQLSAIEDAERVDFVGISTGFAERGPDLGGSHFGLLHSPRVGLLGGSPSSPTQYGALWHALDHELRLRVSSLPSALVGSLELGKYNVLVVPSMSRGRTLRGLLGPSGIERLEDWISNGGTLIAIGSSATDLIGAEKPLTAVKLRRDVLGKLSEYEEELQRLADAKTPKIDFEKLWRGGQTPMATPPPSPTEADPDPSSEPDELATSPTKSEEKKPGKPTPKLADQELKRRDDWERRFRPSGAFLRGHLSLDHWMTAGLVRVEPGDSKTSLMGKVERLGQQPADLPVLFSGSHVFLARNPVETPVRFAEEQDLRLSGLLWPEAARRLARSSYVTRERRGRGQVILFADDPVHRGMLRGTRRLLINAVLFGPGLGANPPVPW